MTITDHTVNRARIFSELEQAGYTHLGSGQDATVWGKDPSEVLKVLMPSANKVEAETSFLKFIDMCTAQNNNPHVPRFIDEYSVFEINGTEYMQVTMERLKPLKKNGYAASMVWAMSDLCTEDTITWSMAVRQMQGKSFWIGFPYDFDGISVQQLLASPVVDAHYHQLFSTMQYFFKNGQKHGLGWDLHTENVMQRSNGTIVITDPFFNA